MSKTTFSQIPILNINLRTRISKFYTNVNLTQTKFEVSHIYRYDLKYKVNEFQNCMV